ncbi:hypothetical protein Bca4012_100727 [Brassica carinata]|uniref:Uncharacterized protein n=1 Tax=Brassica carinata TaxID=52824 RepID=A0A8X7PLZ2_BRACI|nr:hypothetical protein Bca52824_083209 [Brassica carinata]
MPLFPVLLPTLQYIERHTFETRNESVNVFVLQAIHIMVLYYGSLRLILRVTDVDSVIKPLRSMERSVFTDRMVFVRAVHEAKDERDSDEVFEFQLLSVY